MHVMLKWDEEELRNIICPSRLSEEYALLTPKQIGTHLEAWFELFDNTKLESKTDIEGCLIPKAGQNRCGGIPRFVHKHKKDLSHIQSMLGSHLSMNFWLKAEQPGAHYLSGVSAYRHVL